MSLALEKLSRAMNGDRFNEHIECSICLLDYEETDKVTPLPCDSRHYFHTACIKQWARMKLHCPLCQKTFTHAQLEECNNRLSISYKNKVKAVTSSTHIDEEEDLEVQQESPLLLQQDALDRNVNDDEIAVAMALL